MLSRLMGWEREVGDVKINGKKEKEGDRMERKEILIDDGEERQMSQESK